MAEAEETAETDWIGHAGEKHPWLSANILVVEEAERKGQTKVECKEGPRTSCLTLFQKGKQQRSQPKTSKPARRASCLTLFKKGKQQRCLQPQNINRMSWNSRKRKSRKRKSRKRKFWKRKFWKRKFGKQQPVEGEQFPGVAVPTARGRAVSPDPLSPVTFIK